MKNNQNSPRTQKLERSRGLMAGLSDGRTGCRKMYQSKKNDTFIKAYNEAFDKAMAKVSFPEQQRHKGEDAGWKAARTGWAKKQFSDTYHTQDWIQGYHIGYEKYLWAKSISKKFHLETNVKVPSVPEPLFPLFLKNQRYLSYPSNRYYQPLKPKQEWQEALTSIKNLPPDALSDETSKDSISLPHFDQFLNLDPGANLLNASENQRTRQGEASHLARGLQGSTLFFTNSASPNTSATKENKQTFLPRGPNE